MLSVVMIIFAIFSLTANVVLHRPQKAELGMSGSFAVRVQAPC